MARVWVYSITIFTSIKIQDDGTSVAGDDDVITVIVVNDDVTNVVV